MARLVNANGTFAAVARSRDTREAEHAIVEAVPQARYQAFLSNCARFWADGPQVRPAPVRPLAAAPLATAPAPAQTSVAASVPAPEDAEAASG